MLKEKTGIGPGLMYCVLFSSIFGYGTMQSAYVAAGYMGPNGYLGLIFALLLTVPVIAAALAVGNRFAKKSVIEYLPSIAGTIPGKVIGFIYILLIISIMVWSLRAIGESFNVYFLSRTPLWMTVFLVLLSVTYLAHKGIEVISRLAAFIFPLSFIFIILTVVLSFQNFHVDNVRPVFHMNIRQMLDGTMQMFYVFFPLAIVMLIFPYLTEKQRGLSIVSAAVVTAFIPLFLFVFITIGVFGAKGVLRYGWPILEMTRNTNLPSLLQTFGLFYAVTWLSHIFIATGSFYYVAAEGLAQLFGVLNYKWFVLILFPVILMLTLLPPSVVEVRRLFDYLRSGGFIIVFGLPVLLWLTAVILKKGEAADA